MPSQQTDADLAAELEIMKGWCCMETNVVLIPGKCWVAGCREPLSFSDVPNHRPGPGLNTVCPQPIPKGTVFKAMFSATSRGEFDYYIHHGPHDGLKLVAQAARYKLGTPWVEPSSPPERWHTLMAVAFFETTRQIVAPYWCWFDPCYAVAGSQKPLPVRDAVLVVQIVHDPDTR